MLNPGKTVVIAAVLGGFALTGIGVAQAQSESAAKKCYKNAYVSVCVQHKELKEATSRKTVSKNRKTVTKNTVTCSSGTKGTSENSTRIKVESSGADRATARSKTTVKCSSTSTSTRSR